MHHRPWHPVTRPLGLTLRLGPQRRTVALARLFVRESLQGLDPSLVDDGVVVVSELAANAVDHARTSYDVHVVAEAGRARVEVCDQSTTRPLAQRPTRGAERGRGLLLVELIAADWGVEHRPGGKCVWARVGPGPPGLPWHCYRHGRRTLQLRARPWAAA